MTVLRGVEFSSRIIDEEWETQRRGSYLPRTWALVHMVSLTQWLWNNVSEGALSMRRVCAHMHVCMCVLTCVCLSVCQMDSSAFPCLSSFLPISSQSSSFLDSILTASPIQGVWEWVLLFHWLSPRPAFSLPRYLSPEPYCLSSPHEAVAQLQWLPRADWLLVPLGSALGTGACSCNDSSPPLWHSCVGANDHHGNSVQFMSS